MKKLILAIILYNLIGIVIISCEKDDTDSIDITHYDWKLNYLIVNGSKENPSQNYILEFQNDSLFMMDFSINTAGGYYRIVKKGVIEFHNYHAFTEICCDNDFDELLSSTLLKTNEFEVIGDDLTFTGTDEIVAFEKNK